MSAALSGVLAAERYSSTGCSRSSLSITMLARGSDRPRRDRGRRPVIADGIHLLRCTGAAEQRSVPPDRPLPGHRLPRPDEDHLVPQAVQFLTLQERPIDDDHRPDRHQFGLDIEESIRLESWTSVGSSDSRPGPADGPSPPTHQVVRVLVVAASRLPPLPIPAGPRVVEVIGGQVRAGHPSACTAVVSSAAKVDLPAPVCRRRRPASAGRPSAGHQVRPPTRRSPPASSAGESRDQIHHQGRVGLVSEVAVTLEHHDPGVAKESATAR